MWSLLLSLLPGVFSTINGITKAISDEKIKGLQAKTDQEKIAAQERVNTLQAQRDVLVSSASQSKLDIYMRNFIALGPAAYIFTIFFYDKVLGSITQHATDKVTDAQWGVVTAVIGFYFLYSGAVGVARIVKS